MNTQMNKKAYKELIEADIAALRQYFPVLSLAGGHIENVLRWSIAKQFDEKENEPNELEQHKEIIRALLRMYVVDVGQDGMPKASITEILNLHEEAKKLCDNKL